jgi:hypothetical protein
MGQNHQQKLSEEENNATEARGAHAPGWELISVESIVMVCVRTRSQALAFLIFLFIHT